MSDLECEREDEREEEKRYGRRLRGGKSLGMGRERERVVKGEEGDWKRKRMKKYEPPSSSLVCWRGEEREEDNGEGERERETHNTSTVAQKRKTYAPSKI